MAAGGLGAEQRSLSVSRKLGSEKSHGTPSEGEQREGGGKQLFAVFLPLLRRLTCVFVPSLWSSLGLSLASVVLFFFCCSLKEECLDHGGDLPFAL